MIQNTKKSTKKNKQLHNNIINDNTNVFKNLQPKDGVGKHTHNTMAMCANCHYNASTYGISRRTYLQIVAAGNKHAEQRAERDLWRALLSIHDQKTPVQAYIRWLQHLPVRGQRSRSNAKTARKLNGYAKKEKF